MEEGNDFTVLRHEEYLQGGATRGGKKEEEGRGKVPIYLNEEASRPLVNLRPGSENQNLLRSL
jgi:hypothetical protein